VVRVVAVKRSEKRARVANEDHLARLVCNRFSCKMACADRAPGAGASSEPWAAATTQRIRFLHDGLRKDDSQGHTAPIRLRLKRVKCFRRRVYGCPPRSHVSIPRLDA
jgi:hypothetical protein